MAKLTFTSGSLTSEVETSNGVANIIFEKAAQNLGFSGDITNNQAVADFVLRELVNFLVQHSNAKTVSEAAEQARGNAPVW